MKNKNVFNGLINIYKLVLIMTVPFLIIGMVNGNLSISNGITSLILITLLFNVKTIWNVISFKRGS